jgi:hypothetical protein
MRARARAQTSRPDQDAVQVFSCEAEPLRSRVTSDVEQPQIPLRATRTTS